MSLLAPALMTPVIGALRWTGRRTLDPCTLYLGVLGWPWAILGVTWDILRALAEMVEFASGRRVQLTTLTPTTILSQRVADIGE